LEIVSPKFIEYCPIIGNEREKIKIMVDEASCHLSCYTSKHASIWHRYKDLCKKNCSVYIQCKGGIVVVDIKQYKSQFKNSNFTITQSAKFF